MSAWFTFEKVLQSPGLQMADVSSFCLSEFCSQSTYILQPTKLLLVSAWCLQLPLSLSLFWHCCLATFNSFCQFPLGIVLRRIVITTAQKEQVIQVIQEVSWSLFRPPTFLQSPSFGGSGLSKARHLGCAAKSAKFGRKKTWPSWEIKQHSDWF